MGIEPQEYLFPSEQEPQGALDAQMELPLAPDGPPEPELQVVKQDGRRVALDRRRIAEDIYHAQQTVGAQDWALAQDLANAVGIYLGKRAQGGVASIEHVHDAVERVLIQMSHAPTALSYARGRGRRARLRRLREGGTQALLSELRDARGPAPLLPGLSPQPGQGRVIQLQRAELAVALEHETGLTLQAAEEIADEVEGQIAQAGLQTLTRELVHALVGAKLLEKGLADAAARWRRLDLPLEETARVLRGLTGESVHSDPVGTDLLLARAVKQSYALSQVYAPAVSQAHADGELHLQDLGHVDRFFSLALPLSKIAEGAAGAAADAAVRPGDVREFLAQWARLDDVLKRYLTGSVAYPAANLYLAPYVRTLSDGDVAAFAKMLVYEFAYRMVNLSDAPPPCVEVQWTTPETLAQVPAVLPRQDDSAPTYGAFYHDSQRLAWALARVIRDGSAQGRSLPAPLLELALSPAFYKDPGHREFLRLIAECAARRRNVVLRLDRDEEEMPPAVAGGVTLNLVRAACQANEPKQLFPLLDRLVRHAADAHRAKAAFLDELLTHEEGPLAGLKPLLHARDDSQTGTWGFRVDVCGLNECVRMLLGSGLDEAQESLAFGEEVLRYLRDRCRYYGGRHGLLLLLGESANAEVLLRFMEGDSLTWPAKIADVLDVPSAAPSEIYSGGVGFCGGPSLTPLERVMREGLLRRHLDTCAESCVNLPREEPAEQALVDFINKVWEETAVRRLRFV